MPIKTCTKCKTKYEYEDQEQLKDFFYKKGQWFQNVCKTCTKEEHRRKYKEGKYNYKKKKEYDYFSGYSIGHYERC